MNAPEGTSLADDETLARFVLKKDWIRKIDNTVKPDAFIPPRDLQLSVTRQVGISTEKLVEIGKSVASQTGLQFFGRADIETRQVLKNALRAVAWPLADNANHAHLIGWPADKALQKTIALDLAAVAVFVPA